MAQISFSGSVDRPLYERALRVHGTGGFGLAFFLFLVAGLAFLPLFSAEHIEPKHWGPPLFLALLGTFIAVMPRLVASRALKTSALISEEFTGQMTETGITMRSVHTNSDLPWSVFHRVLLTDDLALLYLSAHQFLIFSNRFFLSRNEWDSFTQTVLQHVKQKRRPRPVLVAVLWAAGIVLIFILWSFWKVLGT